MSHSLWPHGLYSPWNSPGQNTGVGSLSLLQGIFPAQESNWVSCIAGSFFTNRPIKEASLYQGSPYDKVSVYKKDLFAQCLFLCKPLIMSYKDNGHVLSAATEHSRGILGPGRHNIFFYVSMLILHRIKTMRLSTQINSFHAGWSIKNIAWECEIWILDSILY